MRLQKRRWDFSQFDRKRALPLNRAAKVSLLFQQHIIREQLCLQDDYRQPRFRHLHAHCLRSNQFYHGLQDPGRLESRSLGLSRLDPGRLCHLNGLLFYSSVFKLQVIHDALMPWLVSLDDHGCLDHVHGSPKALNAKCVFARDSVSFRHTAGLLQQEH